MTPIFPEAVLVEPFGIALDGVGLGIGWKGDLSLRIWVEGVRLLWDG